MLICSEAFGAENELKPPVRIRNFVQLASEPLASLSGPVPATERLLKRCGMSIRDVDLFEINEAFAVLPLTYVRHFDIDPERVNVNGAAIAWAIRWAPPARCLSAPYSTNSNAVGYRQLS